MVVSNICTSRAKGAALFEKTYGARLMLSTPPAITTSASPDRDHARSARHGIEPGAAQAVEGGARHVDGQPCEQRAHAGDVAIVFARLVGAA